MVKIKLDIQRDELKIVMEKPTVEEFRYIEIFENQWKLKQVEKRDKCPGFDLHGIA